MLDIAICDNDRIFTENFKIMLLTIALKEHFKINIDVYNDGIELIRGVCNQNRHYDIIFLEIKMKYMDGLETAKRIRIKNDHVYIIYVTNYYNYAIVAYDVQPFQFLVKPIDLEVLNKYFLSAADKIYAGDYYFTFSYKRDFYKLFIKDILYFESKKRLVHIFTSYDREFKFYGKLNEIEQRLNYCKIDFWRIHQSFLINTRYILRKSYDQVELINGKVIFISEDRRKAVKSYDIP